MRYRRMPIEVESPEELGYGTIRYNLAESSRADLRLGDLGIALALDDLLLQYGDHRGHPGLRALLAAEAGADPRNVLLTPGAAGALFLVATALLEPGDHLVVVRPNYATNLETPRAIGARLTVVDLEFDQAWACPADRIEAALEPGTRLISVTTPHNPTGTVLDPADLRRIATLAEARGIAVVVDETYRDLSLAEPEPFAAALSPAVISVSSFSKAYGLPGLRLGWLICRDEALLETLLAAKEQVTIAGPVVDEEVGYQVYRRRAELRPAIVQDVRERLALVRNWIGGQDRIEWVEPRGGVVAFPRIRPVLPFDADRFYRELTARGTYVGPGHWFERDRRYFRLGFGWPSRPDLLAGLAAISAAATVATSS